MGIRDLTSRAWRLKGEYCNIQHVRLMSLTKRYDSFGWVNASYVYGLQIIDAHMKRALGSVAGWDTFKKMTEAANAEEANKILYKAQKHAEHGERVDDVKVAHNTHEALPHSHEDAVAHKATHGNEERKEHKAPEAVRV